MKSIQIFISSPGDVKEERHKAEQVIADLQRNYAAQAVLEPVMWEDLALPATASFQESIDYLLLRKPIEIAVFILWSRLGSPLGAAITRPDGSLYRSGTEREFEMMLTLFEQSGRQRPLILAYARDDEATWKQSLSHCQRDQLEEMISQQRLAESFIKEQFHDNEGHNLRAYHSYREPVSFAQRLRTHLRAALDELLATDASAPRWNEAPYRSLEVFDIQHAPIFFGRSEEACDVMDRLRKTHDSGSGFVVIVGTSGSGKSSLARAGVAASLVQHAYDENIRAWRSGIFMPGMHGDDLLLGLTKIVAGSLPDLLAGGSTIEAISSSLAKDAQVTITLSLLPAFARAEEKAGGEVRLLMVLDQMEELWTDRRITDKNREQFLEAIEALAQSQRVDFVATLRSDFYAQAQASPAFLRLKGEIGQIDLVPPGTSALQRMIVEPARMAGLQFERDERTGRTLDQTILEEATQDPAALPLLQYALSELYDQRDPSNRLLTFEAYEKMGGVEGAIGQRAASVFAQIPESSRAALGEILPLIVTVDIDGEQNAVRRRASLAELTSTPERRILTESLISARFLTTDQDRTQSIASLAHEALLRRWEALAKWVQANRNDLRLRSRIEQSQQRWEQENREPSLLLAPGLPLEEGRQLLIAAPTFLTPSSNEYITASIAHNEAVVLHQARRRQIVLAALSCLTLMAIGGGLYSWTLRTKAEAAEAKADTAKDEAKKQELLATTRLNEQTEQAKEASKVLFAYGIEEYKIGRFQSGVDKLLRARTLRADTDPLKQSYESVIVDRMTRGNRSWAALGQTDFLAFSRDGSRILTAYRRNTVRLWDSHMVTPLGKPIKHDDDVSSVAFSPDCSRIATAAFDHTACLWDAQTGAPVGELMKHVDSFTFSPDGSRIATACGDNTARIWDTQTGAPLGELMKHENSVSSVAFSPDGSRIATGTLDKTARVWDAQVLLPRNFSAFIDRFAEGDSSSIPRDLEFEAELKKSHERKRFLYRSSTAVQSVAKKDWFGAKYHLPWLIEQEPNNPRWKKLLTDTTTTAKPNAEQVIETKLVNGSFEEPIDDNWTMKTFAKISHLVSQTSDAAKTGQKSLLIESETPNDVRCLQTVIIKPNTQYRLRGWVKTLDLVVAQVGGTTGAHLCIDDKVCSLSVLGTGDWRELTLEFNSDDRTVVSVGPRFGYFGSTCTGTAWFDDIELEELSVAELPTLP